MQLLRLLAGWPLAVVWHCITSVRNYLYDVGLIKSVSFSIPVVCVGNLAVGGTGKTPMINYLTRYFVDRGTRVAILSRGYGRSTRGFMMVDARSTPGAVGDEPAMYFRRFGGKVPVAVGENRVRAIRMLREKFPALQLVLLDDGFQHRALQPSATVLLTTFQNPFFSDHVIPAGWLREARSGARRAAMVVVTKVPDDIEIAKKNEITAEVHRYLSPGKPVFFSTINYGEPVCFGKPAAWVPRVFLISGVANPQPLVDYLKRQQIDVLVHWEKADHFAYNDHEMELIIEAYEKLDDCVIVTTEKDFVKLSGPEFERYRERAPFFYIPVEFSFSKEKENFEAELEKLMTTHK